MAQIPSSVPSLQRPVRADRAAVQSRVVLHTMTWIVVFAAAKLIFHAFTNGQYGFHRDELATLDDARYLAWGYVAYPPVTPFIARIALTLVGPSLVILRLFSALSQSIAIVLAALIARELGGGARAQWIAAIAVAIAPVSLANSTMFMYVSFDYLWWVLIAWFVVRLLKSNDPRWWLGIGAAIGIGMMTKYTMAFYVVGIVGGVLLTRVRRHLRSPWLWAGVALSLLIFLPNLIWQIQHDFISVQFLGSIHERDIGRGRTQAFLMDQLYQTANPVTIPLWIAGLIALFRQHEKRYRMLGWMSLITILVFAAAQGRGYYTGGTYPALLAAGAVWLEQWVASLSTVRSRIVQWASAALLLSGGVFVSLVFIPLGAVHSPLFNFAVSINDDLWTEQIGWPDLVKQVDDIYDSLPAEEQARTGIYAGNYGEAGAINLYGRFFGLPTAISGANSYWLRGYGDPPPETVIVLGYRLADLSSTFESCELAGRVTNRYGIENEESTWYDGIFVCRGLKVPWPELWPDLQTFG